MDLENQAQRQQLQEALLNAFPDAHVLARMVDRLNIRLARITDGGSLDHQVFKVIEWARANDRGHDLITQALAANPTNPKLRAFAVEVGLLSNVPEVNPPSSPRTRDTPPDNASPAGRRGVMGFTPVQMPLEKFDPFFQVLEENLDGWVDRRLAGFQAAILKSLMFLGHAQHVFLAQHSGHDWQVVVENEVGRGWARDALVHNDDLIELLDRTRRQGERRRNSNPYQPTNLIADWLPHPEAFCLMIQCPPHEPSEPLKVLCLYGLEDQLRPDLEIATILNTLLKTTGNLEVATKPQELQTILYNTLKREFKTLSDAVYERQFRLFGDRLKTMTVFFEPVISLTNPPYIASWEALARDVSDDPKAPEDLFVTAELWGNRFLLELDIYFLHKAIDTYLNSPERPHPLRRAWEILDLSVNVYPASLIRRVYREAILQVFKEGRMPLNKLILEISEKFDLPEPEAPTRQIGRIEWFNEQLDYYTERGIRFAIDDFGVGHASSSRLSGLRAAIIKVDRDALLRGDRNRLKYVLDEARMSGGHRKVIVEGYGPGTKLTLDDLCRLKVLYVQGHNLIKAVNVTAAERKLMQDIFGEVRRAVQTAWL